MVTSKDIKDSRRVCREFYSRVFSQKVSHYFSAFFVNVGISPNTITYLMLPAVFPFFLLFTEKYFLQILGAFSLVLINIFDTVDGEVARYTGNLSPKGVYLDNVIQLAADIVMFTILLVNYFIFKDEMLVGIFVAIYFALFIIDVYSKKVAKSFEKASEVDFSYKRSRLAHRIVHMTSSSTFLTHSYFLVVGIEVLFPQWGMSFTLFYFFYMAVLQLLKTGRRQYLFLKSFDSENL